MFIISQQQSTKSSQSTEVTRKVAEQIGPSAFFISVQKPDREGGRNAQLVCIALANARASALQGLYDKQSPIIIKKLSLGKIRNVLSNMIDQLFGR
jgi:hypothetical protein